MLCAAASYAPASSFGRDRGPVEQPVSCLEYFPEAGGMAEQIVLDTFPFRLGRSPKAHLTIPCNELSREHAEIYCVGDRVYVRDLGSTNGTFVNGQRVRDAELTDGDILHLAHQEFRFSQRNGEGEDALHETYHMGDDLRKLVGMGRSCLENLLSQRRVRALFQPIMDLRSQAVLGFEALGRGAHQELSNSPGELFALAERYQKATELSRVFRDAALAEANDLPGRPVLFFNLHPSELRDPLLLKSLEQLRTAVPRSMTLVLELHENTVADLACLRTLRKQLRGLNILLAYDDFGAGQSRLGELAEVPPDFLKLNISLVRELHLSPQRQSVVRSILHVARDLGIQVIAEGIETEEEAQMCRELGCPFGQGYWLGRPSAASVFTQQHDTWEVAFDSESEEGLQATIQVAL